MNTKTWLPLALALAMGLVAAMAGRGLLKMGPGSASAAQPGKVVVARGELAAGHILSAEDLELAAFSGSTRNTFGRMDDVVGRVLKTPVVAGQALFESLLAPKGAGGGLQALVPEGMRAMTIEVNEVSGVGGLLLPGCRVDVITTLHDVKANQPRAKTITENVRVLSVGQKMSSPGNKEEAGPPAKTVTLLVNPRDAEKIQLACLSGKTQLVLRGSMDSAPSGAEGLSVAELIGATTPVAEPAPAPAPAPVPAPVAVKSTAPAEKVATVRPAPPHRTIHVIHGGKEATVQLEIQSPDGASGAAANPADRDIGVADSAGELQ